VIEDRAAALAEIARLARAHRLTLSDIASATGLGITTPEADAAVEPRPSILASPAGVPNREAPSAPAGGPASAPRGVLVRALGFLGGTFVFAGVGVFIALQWDAMNTAARIIVTLGAGLAAFVLAALARRDPRFERAATPLYLTAAALEPVGMLVAFEEFGSGGDWRWAGLVTAAVMAIQFGLAFFVARRSTLLFVSVTFAMSALWTGLDLMDMDGGVMALTLGGTLVLSAIWADRQAHRDVTPPWYFVGAAAVLGGVFDLVESSPVEVIFVAAAASFVYLSVVVRSRTLLVVSILAILAYTGYFTAEHFADSIGWPLALVGFGLAMIGLSALAVRLDRRYVRGPRP
jgi:hypothetical protein